MCSRCAERQGKKKKKKNMIELLLARGGRAHRHQGSRTAANPDMLTARGLTKQWLRVFLSCASVCVCVVLNFEDKALLLQEVASPTSLFNVSEIKIMSRADVPSFIL